MDNNYPTEHARRGRSPGLDNREDMGRDSFLLQDVLFPQDERQGIDDLYILYLSGRSEIQDGALCLDAETKVSFNTYFNSFYESYWEYCTSVRELSIELEFSGTLDVEIFRENLEGANRLSKSRLRSISNSTQKIKIDALVGEKSQLGRIFVDIAADEKSKILGLRFVTSQPPVADVSITLGICTYNREPYLLHNLRQILAEAQGLPELRRAIVVNHGKTFTHPELQELFANQNLLFCVQQENLGGSGGFSRTMCEAETLPGVTHHVLMDDDAVLDARVLKRLCQLLKYVTKELAVGGHMLDLLRPNHLYEAGAKVTEQTAVYSQLYNQDLRDPATLRLLTRVYPVDYNAWWFCALPMTAIRKAGYSLPIFIHVDDMEYGVRLKEMDVYTVPMPGICVWHEPFYAKASQWQ